MITGDRGCGNGGLCLLTRSGKVARVCNGGWGSGGAVIYRRWNGTSGLRYGYFLAMYMAGE